HLRRHHKFCPSINLHKLWSLGGNEKFEEISKDKSVKAPVIDLVQFGYYKLLGRGHLPKVHVIVYITYCQKAEDKIKKAGGVCLLRA
uniref:Large ribosomal subunit protein uL15 n=1 Tax=Megaselia scalaris TaxID=36166 RepID=T1H7A4_MEGSC